MYKFKEESTAFNYVPEISVLYNPENTIEIRTYIDFHPEFDGVYNFIKRALDLTISSFLLLALSPLILISALSIKLSSKGPTIFSQKRMTKDGKIFKMYKLRTMHLSLADKNTPIWTQANDSRITKFGKLLRKTRIDELPQLVNVIKGEMSLIGPRPERPELTNLLESHFPQYKKRLEVKAGLSGLAQVTSGYAHDILSYQNKLNLDLDYIENRSLLLDLKIALKTFLVVLTCKGAR